MELADIDPFARKILTEDRLNRFLTVAANRLACLTVIFERVRDPLNVSACLRSTEAFGLSKAWYVGDEPLEFNRTISGQTKRWMEVRQVKNFKRLAGRLKADGFSLVGTMPAQNSQPLTTLELPPKTAVVMGNEHVGLSEIAQAACDHLVTIPMYGFAESFNISTATALVLRHFSEAYRARGGREIFLPDEQQRQQVEAWVEREVAFKTRRSSRYKHHD